MIFTYISTISFWVFVDLFYYFFFRYSVDPNIATIYIRLMIQE